MKRNIFITGFISAIAISLLMGQNASAKTADLAIRDREFDWANNLELAIDNNPNNQEQDNLIRLIFFVSLIGTGALFWYFLKGKKNKSKKFSFAHPKNSPNTQLLDRVSPKLRRQLLRLINDPQTANRLLMGIYKNNSDRSPNWLAEKAIYDLRRGR